MLRTSSQEGGLQQRTESPKATSGAPNCFVRPVAVASIFRPALGGSSGVSSIDGKPAVPEKLRSAAAKDSGKEFGSSLSSQEFSRRRQSFDTKTGILCQNVLKQISGSTISPVSEQINDVSAPNEKNVENFEGNGNCSEIRNSVERNVKDKGHLDEVSAVIKSFCITEKAAFNSKEKGKKATDISNVKSGKPSKLSLPPSELDLAKVTSVSEDRMLVIQNGVLEDSDIAVVETKTKGRNTGATESIQKSVAPQTERRRRNKFPSNTCVDKESVTQPSSTLDSTESLSKNIILRSRNVQVSDISSQSVSSETTSKSCSPPTEYVLELPAPRGERRRRDRLSGDVGTEQNRVIASDSHIAEKELSSQKSNESNCSLVSKDSFTTQTKCELQAGTNENDTLSKGTDENTGSSAVDTQSVNKFRTCRRTSDVIAAKIQTIFSKSDKPSLPSSNKSTSTKDKTDISVTGKKPAVGIHPAEKDDTHSQELPEQKVSQGKILDQKEDNSFANKKSSSNTISNPVLPFSADSGHLNKLNFTNVNKKDQIVKCLETVQESISADIKLKQIQSETSSSVGDVSVSSSLYNKKSVITSRIKDIKFNSDQKSCVPNSSVVVQSTVGSDTSDKKSAKPSGTSEKRSAKLQVASEFTENIVITKTKNEVAPVAIESTSNSLSVTIEKAPSSVTRKPGASINFLITEVNVENSPNPSQQKVNIAKTLPLQVRKNELSEIFEQKSCDTQKSCTKKVTTEEDSKVIKKTFLKSETINSETLTSKISDKNKLGNVSLLKEDNKTPYGNQHKKNSETPKTIINEKTNCDTKSSSKIIINEKTNCDTKSSSTNRSELINSAAVVPKTSERDKTGKVLPQKESNEVPSENSLQKKSQVKNLNLGKNISNDSKTLSCASSERLDTCPQILKPSEKEKTDRVLPFKERNKVPSAKLFQKTSQVQKSGVDTEVCNFGSSELINSGTLGLKPSEKGKTDKTASVKEKNIEESETLLQKISGVQKSIVEGHAGGDRKTSGVCNSGFENFGTQTLKPSEKDKINKVLPFKEGSKVLPEKSQQKGSQIQKSAVDTKINFSSCEPLNSKTEALKLSEKDKVNDASSLKEGNVAKFENLQNKSSLLQKSSAEGRLSGDTKAQNTVSTELAKSSPQVQKPLEKDKAAKSLALKDNTKVVNENLQQKPSQKSKSDVETNSGDNTKAQSSTTRGFANSGSTVVKPLEKGGIEKALLSKESDKVPSANLQQKISQSQNLGSEKNTSGDSKAENFTSSELLNSSPKVLKQVEKDKTSQDFQPKETEAVIENISKKSCAVKKWGVKENASSSLKVKNVSANSATVTSNFTPLKVSGNTSSKTLLQKNEIEVPSENKKEKFDVIQKLGADKLLRTDSSTENIISNTESLNSSKIDNREQHVEVKTKSLNPVETIFNVEQPSNKGRASPKVKKISKQEQKSDEVEKYSEVKKITKKIISAASTNECSPKEGIKSAPAKSVPSPGVQISKGAEAAQLLPISQSPTIKRNEKQEMGESLIKEKKYLTMQEPQDSARPTIESAQKDLSVGNAHDKLRIHQDALHIGVSDQTKQTDATSFVSSVASVEDTNRKENSVSEAFRQQMAKDFKNFPVSPVLQGNSSFRNKMQEICEETRKLYGETPMSETDDDDLDAFIGTNISPSTKGSRTVFNTEFPGRSFSSSKLDTPRPPERKRSGYLREVSTLTSPPRVPLRSMSRTGSLKHPADSRLSMERSLSILRSSSQSVLSQPYTPQRISYTEMLSKLGTCGRNPPLTTSNRKFATSQVSELWADLSEEQSNGAHTSEMLESETSERMRLEKEVQELQSRYSQVQQKSDKMEMEMMEARVYHATEVNGDISEDENDVSIYKQKYERAVRDMEIMKRRLQQQHEEEMEQSLMLKKAADKRLTEALEDIEEERQVINQWKRKAQKLGAELQDLRLMLEEQMARNGELEKKQRRFDAELSSAQEEMRKEHQLREKLNREKDQTQLEKYSLEQELQATRLDMDMQHEKIAILNRELDELSLSSKGEEEVTQLKRTKQELERKTRDQEEELEELAGQVQMLEQAKLRLEMSLEKLRQEHRRESSVRDEEIEEIRACSSKKIKNLEAQLENEQEERHQLVKQKHEFERRIIELSDQPPPQDPEIERRLRRDLKRTKALLRDAQSMLEHVRDGQANKTLIRQLKNQLEDAEFTKSVAIKARQTAELELQELQSQLEEVTRTKNDIESRCLQLSREKSAIHTQLEEMEEEMAEVMKKYKAAVAQMSIDQKSLAEQNLQISDLENEKLCLKEQLAEVSTKLDHISVQTEDSSRVHRLDAKVRELESKIELEQTTRSRLEHQIARLKEQCDRSREECDSLRNKEIQAQEGTRRLQRQLRELREDYAALQQKESEAYRKQHELEMALENTEADLQVTKNDLRLACQRIQDLQNALEDDLDSGTDVPDESGTESDSSLDISVLGRQCLTPLQRSDSVSSNTSIGSDSRQFRALPHGQDMAFYSRMMQIRTPMDFLI